MKMLLLLALGVCEAIQQEKMKETPRLPRPAVYMSEPQIEETPRLPRDTIFRTTVIEPWMEETTLLQFFTAYNTYKRWRSERLVRGNDEDAATAGASDNRRGSVGRCEPQRMRGDSTAGEGNRGVGGGGVHPERGAGAGVQLQ